MGTRINYEIGKLPSVILFSNSSHHTECPETLFREAAARHGTEVTALVRELLAATYSTDSGRHRAGDFIYSVDLGPGDREKILRLVVDTDGAAVQTLDARATDLVELELPVGYPATPLQLAQTAAALLREIPAPFGLRADEIEDRRRYPHGVAHGRALLRIEVCELQAYS